MSHTSEFANASAHQTNRVLQPNGSMRQNANHSADVHYRQLLNSIPGMAGLADATGAVMYLNSAWSQFTGLAPERGLGWEWCQHIHQDDRDRSLEQWQSALQNSQALETTLQLLDAAGQAHSCIFQASCLSETGEVNAAIWLLTFTPRLAEPQVARELEKERELHSVITKNMAEGICLVRQSDGIIVYANPKFERMFGYDSGELTGQYVAIVNYADETSDAEAVYHEIAQSVSEQGEATYEVRNVKKDGTPFWCQATTAIFEHPEHGEVLVAVQQDITERKQAEAEIRQLNAALEARVAQRTAQLALSNQRYANLTQLSPVGIFSTTPTGECLYINDRWCNITGLSPADVEARGWTATLHPDDQERVDQAWTDAVEHHTPFQLEYRFQRPDGKLTWVFGQAIPEINPQGAIVGYIGTITDITDRKHSEEILQERAAELTRLNTLLATTATLLEERNRELDQFAYVASHDLKAPLRAIANLSEWIEEDLQGILPPENQQQMQLLRGRVQRMEALINGLLEFSRVGRSDVTIQPLDLGELLADIIDSLAPPNTFTIQLPPKLPALTTRGLLLQQVLTNLISNAIKHHDRSDGTVTLSLHDQQQAYEFVVADDGPGIAPQYHDRIFEIFQTLDTRDSKESTGVGLAIVKKIVEAEGGTITIQSDIGQGTTFRFTWLKQAPPASE